MVILDNEKRGVRSVRLFFRHKRYSDVIYKNIRCKCLSNNWIARKVNILLFENFNQYSIEMRLCSQDIAENVVNLLIVGQCRKAR